MNILKTNTINFFKPIGYQTPLNRPHKIVQNYQTNIYFGEDCDVSKAYASPQIDKSIPKARKIWSEFEKADEIAILTHKYADGDAIGTGLALKHTLKEQYPDKKIDFIVPEGVPSFLKILPGADSVISGKDIPTLNENYLTVMVDCDERTVDGREIFNNAKTKVNIDHHESNINLKSNNELYLIKDGASSATEVLYNSLFRALHIKPSKKAAECLLTGLITDTGNFAYTKNKHNAIQTKDRLLNILYKNAHTYSTDTLLDKIHKNEQKSNELGAVLDYVTSDEKKGKAISPNGVQADYFVLSQEDINNFNVTDSKVDIKSSINENINKHKSEAPITAFLWETGDEDEVKLSLRSNEHVVKDFVEKFGGGGHAHAAGVTLHGQVQDVVSQFTTEIQNHNF